MFVPLVIILDSHVQVILYRVICAGLFTGRWSLVP
nr:MAG TPA: hypothetical protein [Caudoviricetes sp.]DAW11245.1 MAG TPA: hypothetical protein [Caudoviricetes sp.]